MKRSADLITESSTYTSSYSSPQENQQKRNEIQQPSNHEYNYVLSLTTTRVELPCTRMEFWQQLATSPAARKNFTDMILAHSDNAVRQGLTKCGGVFVEFPDLLNGCEDMKAMFEIISTNIFDEKRANSIAFHPQFAAADDSPIIAFQSLNRDTRLIVPNRKCFHQVVEPCLHLVSFLRAFNQDERVHNLWETTANSVIALHRELGANPKKGTGLYVSTHGGGVPWLHVRLCETPKYYAGDMGQL
jgi:hypothetical protein